MNDAEIRHCVRCGASLNRVQKFGKERPVCKNCGWVYFPDPKVAVVVLVKKNDKLLLVRRANDPQRGKWTLPGGFMDAGEDPQDAAKRECLEETGLQIKIDKLLDLVARPVDSIGAHLIIYYAAQILGGSLAAGDDADAVDFFRPDQLPELAFESPQTLVIYSLQ